MRLKLASLIIALFSMTPPSAVRLSPQVVGTVPTLGITLLMQTVNSAVTIQTITAEWTDTTGAPGTSMQDIYFFSNGSLVLNQGLTSSPTNTFAEQYVGPVQPNMFFTVCNSSGTCIGNQVFLSDPTDGPQPVSLFEVD